MADHELVVKGDKVLEKAGGKVIKEKDYSHVIAGYKATISRENVSEDAKEHARALLKELEASHARSIGSREKATPEQHDEHYGHVVRGLKASLKNPHVSEEAKKHCRERLEEMDEPFEEP